MKAVVLSLVLGCGATISAEEFTFGALGGSPIPIGAGARALGMGGAFSALADDGTAATWNPAGMAQLERPELAASAAYYLLEAESASGERDRDEWRLEHAGGVLPFFLVGLQQSVGLSWQRQYDLTASVDFGFTELSSGGTKVDSHTRFDRDGSYASLSASYAVSASDTLNLGVSLSLWDHDLTQAGDSRGRFREVNTLTTASVQLTTDTDQAIDEEVVKGTSLVLGAQWRALPRFTLSLVGRPRFELDIEQRIAATETTETILLADGSILDRTTARQNSRTEMTTTYPSSVTVGAAFRPDDHQALTFDLTWTQWSRYTNSRRGEKVSAISSLLRADQVDDDFSLRLGYEHLLIMPRWVFAVRGGALYERLPGMAPFDDLANAGEAEATTEEWYGLTLGVTGFRRRVTYDLATQLRWGRDVGAGVYAAPDETADVLNLVLRGGVGFMF